MKILVTGANGYIGRHVVNALLNKNVQVIACDVNVEGIDKRAESIPFNIFLILSRINMASSTTRILYFISIFLPFLEFQNY